MTRDEKLLKEKKIFTKLSGDVESEVIDAFMQTSPVYDGYEEFIKSIEFEK
jgi:hypothetical protein